MNDLEKLNAIARLGLAQEYYTGVVLPGMTNGTITTPGDIVDSMQEFRQTHQGELGADFEPLHVWGVAFTEALRWSQAAPIVNPPPEIVYHQQVLDWLTPIRTGEELGGGEPL